MVTMHRNTSTTRKEMQDREEKEQRQDGRETPVSVRFLQDSMMEDSARRQFEEDEAGVEGDSSWDL